MDSHRSSPLPPTFASRVPRVQSVSPVRNRQIGSGPILYTVPDNAPLRRSLGSTNNIASYKSRMQSDPDPSFAIPKHLHKNQEYQLGDVRGFATPPRQPKPTHVRLPRGGLVARGTEGDSSPNTTSAGGGIVEWRSPNRHTRCAALQQDPMEIARGSPTAGHQRPSASQLFKGEPGSEALLRELEAGGFDRGTSQTPLGDWRAGAKMSALELGKFDSALKNSLLETCMHEWGKAAEERDAVIFQSPVLKAEMKLQRVSEETENLGTPNAPRTRAAFELFDAVVTAMPHLHPTLSKLREEIQKIVFPPPRWNNILQKVKSKRSRKKGVTFPEVSASAQKANQSMETSYYDMYQRAEKRVSQLQVVVRGLQDEHNSFVEATNPKKLNALRSQVMMRTMLCGFTLLAWRRVVREKNRSRVQMEDLVKEKAVLHMRALWNAWLQFQQRQRRKKHQINYVRTMWNRKETGKRFVAWRVNTKDARMERVRKAIGAEVGAMALPPHVVANRVQRGGEEAKLLLQQLPTQVAQQILGAVSSLQSLKESLQDRSPEGAAQVLAVVDPAQAAHVLMSMNPLAGAAEIMLAMGSSEATAIIAAMGPIKTNQIIDVMRTEDIIALAEHMHRADLVGLLREATDEMKLLIMRGVNPDVVAETLSLMITSDSAKMLLLMDQQERSDVLAFMPKRRRASAHEAMNTLNEKSERLHRNSNIVVPSPVEQTFQQTATPALQSSIDCLEAMIGPDPRVLLHAKEAIESLTVETLLVRWANFHLQVEEGELKLQLQSLQSLHDMSTFQKVFHVLLKPYKQDTVIENPEKRPEMELGSVSSLFRSPEIVLRVLVDVFQVHIDPAIGKLMTSKDSNRWMFGVVALGHMFSQASRLPPQARQKAALKDLASNLAVFQEKESRGQPVPASALDTQLIEISEQQAELAKAAKLHSCVCSQISNAVHNLMIVMCVDAGKATEDANDMGSAASILNRPIVIYRG